MRAILSRLITNIITSPRTRAMKRAWYGAGRTFGGPAIVHYFHEPADPYSQLAAQLLEPLARKYKVTVKTWLVSPPGPAAAPELAKLQALAKTDAALVAPAYGLKYPAPDSTPKDAVAGDATRDKLGHYLSGMFYFEGEWYWSVDRFHFLEERLHTAGLGRTKGPLKQIAPVREVTFSGKPGSAKGATLDYFLSFRSPYTYVAVKRVRKLAEHYGATLRLRFVLPMVMRGLPVPSAKRFYITLDTKREAERLGIPFGTIIDPVGKPTERGLAVLHHAIKLGKGSEFAESFLSGAFAEGIDAGSAPGLLQMATRAGLTKDQMEAALADESWRQVAEANREELFSLGLWGVPSFRVNTNKPHWGQDRLWVIEQELQKV
ncbi:MAG: DsbA family protein [Micropepsaceae bacterium]